MPSQPAWAAPRAVALLIAAYLLIHLGVRLWMGPTLGLDDAEQALFAQHWLLNYRFRAPPLFTWALVGTGGVLGVNMLSISLLRYALLAMIFGLTYLTARRLIRDPALAALATFSFAAIYVFGYYSHHDLTHTTTLSAFIAASWYVFVRLAETPGLRWYLLLGLCFGLGMLGKWNFAMFAVALPLACLAHRGFRHLILTWKIVPAGLVAAAVTLPSALWAVHVGPAAGDNTRTLLGKSGYSFLAVLWKGTTDLAVSVLFYPLPFLVLFLVVFGGAAWRGFRAPEPLAPHRQSVPDARLVGSSIAIAIGLYWLLVPLAGATQFKERLLQPALLILPIYLFMLVELGSPPQRALRAYAIVVAVTVAVMLAARIGIHVAGGDYCRVCRTFAPFEQIGDSLRAAGFRGQGTIVVTGFHAGGNLRVQFPDARLMEIGYPAGVWPKASGNRQCLAVWVEDEGPSERVRARIDAYLAQELGVARDVARREGMIATPLQGSATRPYRLFYGLYDGPQGECR
jgi:4-amino-4-deoxy-L-arabinose transferase-like glycosyltransferase